MFGHPIKYSTIIVLLLLLVSFTNSCSNNQQETPSEDSAQPASMKFHIGLIPEQDLFSQKERYGAIASYISDRTGLEVELNHGIQCRDANVTNNHPVLTGLIVLAQFKESLDYYRLLEVAELEGDLLKAISKGKSKKIKDYYARLAQARIVLRKSELNRIG